MIRDDINLSVALDILNRKIAKLDIEIVKNPDNLKLKQELDNFLNIKEEISRGNVELIKKVINETETKKDD